MLNICLLYPRDCCTKYQWIAEFTLSRSVYRALQLIYGMLGACYVICSSRNDPGYHKIQDLSIRGIKARSRQYEQH